MNSEGLYCEAVLERGTKRLSYRKQLALRITFRPYHGNHAGMRQADRADTIIAASR